MIQPTAGRATPAVIPRVLVPVVPSSALPISLPFPKLALFD